MHNNRNRNGWGSAYCAININHVNFHCLESSSIQSRIAQSVAVTF